MKNNILIVLTFMMSSVMYSQDIETDRPDQTEASSSIPKGTFQIETGMGFENFQSDLGFKSSSYTLPTTLFRVALVNHFELRLVNTLRYDKNLNAGQIGIDDIEVGFKWQWTDGDGLKPQTALMSHVVIPSGVDSSPSYGLVNKLLVSHEFNDRLSLGYNLGHVYFGEGNGDFVYSVALGISITEKVGFYVENYGKIVDMKNYSSNMDAGFTYMLKDNIQFDYSFGIGLHQSMNYQAIGLSIRLPK